MNDALDVYTISITDELEHWNVKTVSPEKLSKLLIRFKQYLVVESLSDF